ncbi:MAG: hypothetical protein LCH91_10790 [Bacteroidetes bacterium]|nr:hypothetical protein [Bacteroidota bacterium]
MKRLIKPFLYATVVLLMSVSCERKDPCDDGSCCGSPSQKLSYIKTVDNARADVGFGGLIIENVEGEPLICYQQQSLYDGKLQQSYNFYTGNPQPFKYRVWGRLYSCDSCDSCDSCPSAVIGTLKYFHIDKIEKVN